MTKSENVKEKSGQRETETKKYGKFASADELYKAYNFLESEFTKKCQKLKYTERIIEEMKESMQSAIAAAERKAVENYLLSLSSSYAPSIISSGEVSVLTPPARPKNLKEAKRLAESFLKDW